jgi:hypothetical protein
LSVGKRTAAFMESLGKKLARGTAAAGIDAVKAQATKWILEYLGLSGS